MTHRMMKKMLKMREHRNDGRKSADTDERRTHGEDNRMSATAEWLQDNEAFLPGGTSPQQPAESYYHNYHLFDESQSTFHGERKQSPTETLRIYPEMSRNLSCEVINPNLVTGSQRVKAIKRLAAQRRRQRKFKQKGTSQRYPALGFDSFIMQCADDSSAGVYDQTMMNRKANDLRKTIRLMEVAAQQKDKEKALIIEVRDAKRKQLNELMEKMASHTPEVAEDCRQRRTVSSKISDNNNNNAATTNDNKDKGSSGAKDNQSTKSGSIRKRGRPPLDPCYPCPSKVKPTSKARIVDDEGSSDGAISDT